MVEQLAPEDLVDDWSDMSTSDLGPGARLGRYELLIPIAYGGMARVWAARLQGHRGFSKLVAIKTILPHLARDPEFERMFLDEARIASGVHHPNVCEIYELGEEGHCLYLAMEWVNGESLVHILRGGKKTSTPIDVRVAARIAADACAGLHAAHNLTDDDGRPMGVVHRDVSPHNILVSIDGNVKMADFGVAKALGQMHQPTSAGQIKGKVTYMAPEQITGAAIDRRSDLYALGCVLYEATTGVPPFRGENDPQIMQGVLKGHYTLPTKMVRGYPPELEAIIARALAGEPRARFSDAERMRVALEEWIVRSGPLVTPSQVAAVVRERAGAEIDRRRDHIRKASTPSDKDGSWPGKAGPAAGHTPSAPRAGQAPSRSGVVQTPLVVGAPPGMRPPSPSYSQSPVAGVSRGPPPAHAASAMPRMAAAAPQAAIGSMGPPGAMGAAGQTPPHLRNTGAGTPVLPLQHAPSRAGGGYFLAAVLGVALAGVLGAGGFMMWKITSANTSAPVATQAPPASAVGTASAAQTAVAALSAPVAALSAPVAAATASAASAEIHFAVTPEQATMSVDGVAQPATARAIPRPPAGKTLTVVFHAPGFEDETLKIDDGVDPKVPVIMVPTPAAVPTYMGRVPVVSPTASAKATSGPALPPNPY